MIGSLGKTVDYFFSSFRAWSFRRGSRSARRSKKRSPR